MKTGSRANHALKGFTLIEMSVVIVVLITLMSFGFGISNVVGNWKLGRSGSETLRSVYTAQRTYLADHPTTEVKNLTPALLLPYVPNGPAVFPTAKSLEGAVLTVRVNVSPPHLTPTAGGINGDPYDPSANTKDSLWDVGE